MGKEAPKPKFNQFKVLETEYFRENNLRGALKNALFRKWIGGRDRVAFAETRVSLLVISHDIVCTVHLRLVRLDESRRISVYAAQLIDGNGEFNVTGLDNFMKAVKLRELGLSYAVVAIMGPQSSGKSTLLNHLFHTRFREMDAFKARSQTMKGIWIAKAVGVEPCTIVMDLEGTDGRERGEDDTTFEKQSAVFALAVSDIVLIKMVVHWLKVKA
ncbi:hypothetical protein TEA_011959 [Camellia sinensis var. sinensis]|uniref:GB1/RHD3-type G domain-containing protein n=1 Tax=Camellia sinensis var. sinensis TaxID=542762 RepID=A0A4S4DP77_CAMSN|nr:hypothetical protein TEA_011959 [Camellia sinensis var. sinensis]